MVAPSAKPLTFEDFFLVKLYTFAQWVQCVRYCGRVLELEGSAPAKGAMKLDAVMKTVCPKCQLTSSKDSWFVKFNEDTRGPSSAAARWTKESKKVGACLDKVSRKDTNFYRGMGCTLDKCDYYRYLVITQPN